RICDRTDALLKSKRGKKRILFKGYRGPQSINQPVFYISTYRRTFTRRDLHAERHAAEILAFPVDAIGITVLAKKGAAHIGSSLVELVDITIRQLGNTVVVTGEDLAGLGVQTEERVTRCEGRTITINVSTGFVLVNNAHILVVKLFTTANTDTRRVALYTPGICQHCSIVQNTLSASHRIICSLVQTHLELTVNGWCCYSCGRQTCHHTHCKSQCAHFHI